MFPMKKIRWLGAHFAAATADVILAVEKIKFFTTPPILRTQDCSAAVFFRFFRHPF